MLKKDKIIKVVECIKKKKYSMHTGLVSGKTKASKELRGEKDPFF